MSIAMILVTLCGCDDRATTVPQPGELVGHYTTSDPRAATATIDIRADGRFTRANWTKRSGSGRWETRLDAASGTIDINFIFDDSATTFFETGNPLLGSPGGYQIGLYISDPDEGAVVFERAKRP